MGGPGVGAELAPMWFQILGGLVVERDGRRLAVGPPKRRLLLAVLLCRPGDVVPIPDLAEALWRGEPPASAAGNLRYHMHQIRQLLGSDSIVRRGAAYGLMIEPTQVDAWRFAGLAAEGEAALGRGDLPATRRASREALALWRGAPFEGMADEPALASDVARWEELRLAVMERNFDAELGLGSGADLVAEVRAAVAEQPFRERFHGQLMHALYRAGRRAEALTAFRDARGLLVQELGIEPGPDLIVLHRAVLRDDPGLKTPPRVDLAPGVQIPATPRHFGGRSEELGRLTELARPDAAPAASLVVVVGPPGVGKTALVAVRWAHGAADRFPDGQLFLDLQGFHRDRPMRPMEAVAHLLVRLGVAAPDVPPQLADAVARYRSLLAGRRMLIVLDNVRSADQVVDLLAGTASTAVVATSRHGLPALVAGHGARQLELQSLGGVEAVRLLGRVLGDRRVAAEPEAATVLADACGRLPLALCISAAILADRPDRRIAEHLADLRRDGLAALDVDGDGRFGLTATFDLSCDALAEPDRRAFRLLGLIPGADFTPDAVAALVGLSQEEAAWLLAASSASIWSRREATTGTRYTTCSASTPGAARPRTGRMRSPTPWPDCATIFYAAATPPRGRFIRTCSGCHGRSASRAIPSRRRTRPSHGSTVRCPTWSPPASTPPPGWPTSSSTGLPTCCAAISGAGAGTISGTRRRPWRLRPRLRSATGARRRWPAGVWATTATGAARRSSRRSTTAPLAPCARASGGSGDRRRP